MRLLFLVITFFWCSLAVANYGHVVVDEVTSVYDGDTFRVNINAWPPIVGERAPIRLRGADTPELRAQCDAEKQLARKAKQFTIRQSD